MHKGSRDLVAFAEHRAWVTGRVSSIHGEGTLSCKVLPLVPALCLQHPYEGGHYCHPHSQMSKPRLVENRPKVTHHSARCQAAHS